MTPFRLLRTTMCALSCLFFGCGSAPQTTEQRYEASLRATDDGGQPLARARFVLGKQPLGITSGAGMLTVRLRGSEGQTLRISLECPDGYSSPESLLPLRLTQTRRVGNAAAQPLFLQGTCTRNTRKVALVVRADAAGAGLPIQIDGKSAGVTDGDGNAHVLINVGRNVRSVAVSLDTTAHPELRPKSPQRVFDLAGRDTVVLFEPAFTTTVAKRQARRPAAATPPARHVPYRID